MSTKLTRSVGEVSLAASQGMVDSLSLDLFHAARDYQVGLAEFLVDRLHRSGHGGLSVNDLGFLSALACGDNTASDIARRLRISRQAAQKHTQQMVAADILTLVDDPERRNRRLIRFTERGTALMATCRALLLERDADLGADAAALRGALPALQRAAHHG